MKWYARKNIINFANRNSEMGCQGINNLSTNTQILHRVSCIKHNLLGAAEITNLLLKLKSAALNNSIYKIFYGFNRSQSAPDKGNWLADGNNFVHQENVASSDVIKGPKCVFAKHPLRQANNNNKPYFNVIRLVADSNSWKCYRLLS